MTRLLPCFILAMACGQPWDDWPRTRFGLYMVPPPESVAEGYLSADDVDAHVEALAQGLRQVGGIPEEATARCVAGLLVGVASRPFPDAAQTGTFNGLVWGNSVWVARMPCRWETALQHELAHVAYGCMHEGAGMDEGHVDWPWWYAAGAVRAGHCEEAE